MVVVTMRVTHSQVPTTQEVEVDKIEIFVNPVVQSSEGGLQGFFTRFALRQ